MDELLIGIMKLKQWLYGTQMRKMVALHLNQKPVIIILILN